MVYKTEYSTRRVYSNSSPNPSVASSFSYTVSPISRRRKPIVTTRVIRIPYAVNTPLSDQQILNLITLGGGRAGSVPRVAVQKLVGGSAPPRSSHRLNELYSELEDEVAGNCHGLGALVPFRRSVTPLRDTTPLRGLSPFRAVTPGPIRNITYHRNQPDEPHLTSIQELQAQPLVRSRADDILLHLALGLNPPLYSLHHIPLRSALDVKEACDVRRQFVHERNMYDPLSRVQSEIYRLAFNRQPRRIASGYIPGDGTLACLSYAGGRPIAKRRRFYPEDESKVVDDLKFNNYYKPSAVGSYYSTAGKKPTYQPVYRSKKSLLGLPDTPKSYRKPEAESKWESKLSDSRRSPPPRPISPPPRRIISSPPPEPARRQPAALDNVSVTLPRPRKSVSDLSEDSLPPPSPTQQLPIPETNVVFKIPRKSISQEPPEPVSQNEEPEEEIQVVKIKRPSLNPASSPEPEPTPEEPVTSQVESSEEAANEAQEEAEAESEPVADPEPVAEPEPEPEPEPAVEETIETEPEAEEAHKDETPVAADDDASVENETKEDTEVPNEASSEPAAHNNEEPVSEIEVSEEAHESNQEAESAGSEEPVVEQDAEASDEVDAEKETSEVASVESATPAAEENSVPQEDASADATEEPETQEQSENATETPKDEPHTEEVNPDNDNEDSERKVENQAQDNDGSEAEDLSFDQDD